MTTERQGEPRERVTGVDDRGLVHKRPSGTSYADLADVYDSPKGGRFSLSQSTRPEDIPRLPPNSPWSGTDSLNGPEFTGYAIDEMEPVGSPAEIAEAARVLASREVEADQPQLISMPEVADPLSSKTSPVGPAAPSTTSSAGGRARDQSVSPTVVPMKRRI